MAGLYCLYANLYIGVRIDLNFVEERKRENSKIFYLSIHIFVVLLEPVVDILDVETLLQQLGRHTRLLHCGNGLIYITKYEKLMHIFLQIGL